VNGIVAAERLADQSAGSLHTAASSSRPPGRGTRSDGVMKRNQTANRSRMKEDRYADLKTILEDRRREILSQVQGKIRDVRAEGNTSKLNEVFDAGESSEADIQEDIEFALIQMKAETLQRINEALNRLEEGKYGYCFECGDEIAGARLRALPFAVRCKDCEEARELAVQRERMTTRRGSSSLFYDMSS
jgi:DnaK suppressor protein